MDIFELYFACTENGKGEQCPYCWFGPSPSCQKRLYLEFRRQVRKMLCPFELGQKVYVLQYFDNPYMKTKLQKGFVYRIKNEGKGWKFSVRSENGEYIGTFRPESVDKTVYKTRVAAEEALRKANRRKKRGKEDMEDGNTYS